MVERGIIRNRAAATKIRDFSKLRFGKITPTDIDGFMDFGDRLFVLIEGKSVGAQMSYGQMLALQRLTDACHQPPRRFCVCFVVDVDVEEGVDVDYATAKVRTIRFGGEWRQPKVRGLLLLDAIVKMRAFADRRAMQLVRSGK